MDNAQYACVAISALPHHSDLIFGSAHPPGPLTLVSLFSILLIGCDCSDVLVGFEPKNA